jgi:predicted NBD/HSP70 family sugar kinase
MKKLSRIEIGLKAGKRVVVGIDLGSKKSVVCRLDEDGKVVERMTIASNCMTLEKVFGKLAPLEIAIETGCHAS